MERLARLSLQHPRATLLFLALVTLGAGAGIPRLTTVVGYRGALSEDHPAIERLDRFIADFGGGLPVAAVWSCDEPHVCTSALDESALRMAVAVEKELSSHPLIRRIDSPATSPLFVPSPDGFAVRRFFEEGALARDREALARRALEDPLWRGNLVSSDGKVGAIVLQLMSSESETTVAVVPALREALRPFERQGFRFHLVGDPVDFAIAGGELEKETPRLVPVMVGLIAVTLYWLFRNLRVTLAALATTGLALLWALGAMGWLGWPQSEVTQALPPQVLVIGVCDTIHVLGVYALRRRGRKSDTVEDRTVTALLAAKEVGAACVITAITTALGFLSFSMTGFDLFARFGVIAAVGAAAALVLTFTLFPLLLVRIPSAGIRAQRASDAWSQTLHVVELLCRRRGKAILATSLLLAGFGLFGASRLRVDVDERALFGSESEVVRWAEFVEDRLRKTDTLEIAIELPAGRTAADPEVMRTVADVARHLGTLEGFGRVRSVLEPVERLHRVLRDDDPAFERPAESSAGNAQLLLALRLESGGRLDEWVTPDLGRLRLSVEVDSAAQSRRGQMLAAVRSSLDERLPEDFRYELTGPFALYYDFVAEIQQSQLSSFASATIGIFAVFAFFLWWTVSPPLEALGLASLGMVPNVLPVICTLGAMGLWGIPLDVGTAMVAAIVLGIATDDTVHVVSQFRDRRREGAPAPEAMARTIRNVGRAAISTAVALSLGFFALMLSSWQSIASFGLLSGIAILAALVAELFLLPSLVMGWSRSRPPAERPSVIHRLGRAGRQSLTVGSLLVLVLVLVLVGREELRDGEQSRLACWVLPNGYVPLAGTLDPSCPLRPHDRVERLSAGNETWRDSSPAEIEAALASGGAEVSVRVARQGERASVSIRVLRESELDRALRFLATGLSAVGALGGVLLLLAYSSAPAGAPLAALYLCLVVVGTSLVSGTSPASGPVPYLLATGLAPSAAGHLLLAFPHPRALLARIPAMRLALYAGGVLNAALLVYGYARYPGLFRVAEWLNATLCAGLLGAFLLTMALGRREAHSALERERSAEALTGMIAIHGIGAVSMGLVPRVLPRSGPWLAAAFLLAGPAPIAFALARYQLNDLRPHLRQMVVGGLVRIVYVGALAALLVALAQKAPSAVAEEPKAVLAAFCAVVFLATLLGERAWRGVRRLLPTVDLRLRGIERDHAVRASELQSAEQAARLAAETLGRGLAATGVSVFLPNEAGWLLAGEYGAPAAVDPATADRAVRLLGEDDAPLHFSIEGRSGGLAGERLRRLGVELVVPFRTRGELVGMAFVGEAGNGLPYTHPEIAFARSIAGRAATAIESGRLAAELLLSERFAAVGRVAAGLAHDVGKPMSVVYERARMMSETESYPNAAREDARGVAHLADEALSAIDRLFAESRRGEEELSPKPLEEVIERAVALATQMHGTDRVRVELPPGLPRIGRGPKLARAVLNLLDNALLASPAEAAVEVRAQCREGSLSVEVVDRGHGMSEEVLARVFEPFYTTRSAGRGRGIGLSASRSLVEAMGGRLELESAPGAGTRARISLPLESPRC